MKTTMAKLFAVSGVALVFCSPSWAADKTVQSREGSCLVSARPTGPAEVPGIASSPDK